MSNPIDIEPSWKEILKSEFQQPYMSALSAFLTQEREGPTPVYPPRELVFNAFHHTPYNQVKVVIMGQDPYHQPGQAQGLSFSVPPNISLPPSLKNIFKELNADLGIPIPNHGGLFSWANQGILLLNATLTVREGQPLSHYGKGWERFTDAVVSKLAEREAPIIFVLWGRSAQEKIAHLSSFQNASHHFILTAPHPSPFSAFSGFFGCRHFSKINEILTKLNKTSIDWTIPNYNF